MVSKLQRDTFPLNQLPSDSVGKDKHKQRMEVFLLWTKNLCLSLDSRKITPQNINILHQGVFDKNSNKVRFSSTIQLICLINMRRINQ